METLTFCLFFMLIGLTFFSPLIGLYNLLFIAYVRPQDHYLNFADLRPALIALIVALFSFAIHHVIRRKQWVRSPQNKAIIALFILIVASRLWAINMVNWATATEDFLRICLVYFMIVNLVDTPKKLKFFYVFICFLYLFVGIRFYYSYKWGTPWIHSTKPGDLSYGFMSNADDLGLGMAVALPFVMIPIFYTKNYLYKAFAGFCSVVFLLSVLGTSSRGAAIGIIFSFIITLLSQIKWKKLKKKHYFVGTVMVLVLFAGFLVKYRWTLLDYKDQIQREDDPGRVGRMATWEAAKRMIQARPIFGVGRGQYVAFWEYYIEPGVYGYQVAHNILYEVTAELGFIGLIFFLYYSLYGLAQARWIYKKFGDIVKENQFFEMLFAINLVALTVFYVNGQFITVAFYWHVYIIVALFVCTRNVFLKYVVSADKKI